MKFILLPLIPLLLTCSSGTQVNRHIGKMIVPGEGTDELKVGMSRAEIVEILKEPELVIEDGRRLDYEKSYGLDFLLDATGRVAEIHFSKTFRGRLPSRVQVGSRMQDVFTAYGAPMERLEVPTGAVGTDDRVLYRTPEAYKISYNRLGLAFWFSPQRMATQIVVFKPLPDRNIRIKPSKAEK
jgi:hypothetical protein